MTETTSITVADGKYTVQHENGANLRALRYGEPWARDLVGDNLVYWMACRIESLEESLRELLGAVHNIEVPQGGLDGFDWLIEAAEKADVILNEGK